MSLKRHGVTKPVNFLDLARDGFNAIEDGAKRAFLADAIKSRTFLNQKQSVDSKKRLFKTAFAIGVEIWFLEDSESILVIGIREV